MNQIISQLIKDSVSCIQDFIPMSPVRGNPAHGSLNHEHRAHGHRELGADEPGDHESGSLTQTGVL